VHGFTSVHGDDLLIDRLSLGEKREDILAGLRDAAASP
jgi:hypothetical protein